MTTHLPRAAAAAMRWLASTEAAADDHGEDGEHHSSFGVHIEYEDLYDTVLFFIAIYMAGQIAAYIKMPSLVGEIVCGILLGPPLADFVPNPEAFVLLGEIGLVLLVIEAGIDIDVSTLKLIGTRGMMIAFVGSVLPIGLGILISIILFGTADMTANIAAGCCFGPTSLGIALNILRSGGVLNTPVGQLIVSAAVIDDMIALIVLSQLEALVGTITVSGILIPVVSALCYLIIGGYTALFVVPPILNKHVLTRIAEEHHGKVELAIMFAFVVGLMPATHYTKASYLMGAFVAGLSFCTSHELHATFVRQFKRLLQWLMRIFFAASIGFQVPIKDLFQGHVLAQGMVYLLALIGKLAVGFMVPNFTQASSFTKWHLRDCLITGFSMAAEGEFAFVIAVFSVENELIDADTYASVVLAVLLSTIIPPFLLRFTISYYHKKAEQELQDLANEEMDRKHQLEDGGYDSLSNEDQEHKLVDEITKRRAVFLCIQTQSESAWGLMPRIMAKLSELKLDIIDHRSWHPRGIDTTLVNEIYVKDVLKLEKKGEAQELLKKRIDEVREALKDTINQPNSSKVKVGRWFPGVVEEIVESVHDRTKRKKTVSLQQALVSEAAAAMDQHQTIQTAATKERSVREILADMGQGTADEPKAEGATAAAGDAPAPRRRRRKMRSTPVVGGDLFGDNSSVGTAPEKEESLTGGAAGKPSKKKVDPLDMFGMRGHRAEIIVDGETFDVRLNAQAVKALRAGFSGDMLDSRGISLDNVSVRSGDVTNMLSGYVRNAMPMSKITEEVDSESETSSIHPHANSKPDPMPPV